MEQPTAASEATIEALREQYQALEYQQARLQESLAALLVETSAQSYDNSESDDLALDSGPESAPAAASLEVQSHFDTDDTDAGWGAEAEATLSTAFTDGITASRMAVHSAECRSTICRLEVAFDDASARLEESPFLPMMIPWQGESHIKNDSTGAGDTVTVYVAREGFTLNGERVDSSE